jgi:hypothetical protein
VFDKWLRFAHTEGRGQEYAGYFNDPNAPWRTSPDKILDDRPSIVFPGELPLHLTEQFGLDETWHVHKKVCPMFLKADSKDCCGHDPIEERPKEVS